MILNWFTVGANAVAATGLKLRQKPAEQQCTDRLSQLVGDIFTGHELVPDIIDRPPPHHLDITFRFTYQLTKILKIK